MSLMQTDFQVVELSGLKKMIFSDDEVFTALGGPTYIHQSSVSGEADDV